jgi:hypothetical protein
VSEVNAGVIAREEAGSDRAATEGTLEQDRPNVRLIVIAVIAILTIICILIVGLVELFDWTLRAEIRRKQLEPVSTLLRDVRADEQAKLNRYQWIDEKAGVVRIPLSRAKQLVLSDYAALDHEPDSPRGAAKAVEGASSAGAAKAESSAHGAADPPPAGERSR